ncbi:MAG: cyanophycin synthetase [Pseudomonadota bacterium]
MQLIEIAGARITLIDESYNANPASMASSIALLGAQTPAAGGRRIAVLGDMLELGPASAALHRDLAQPLIEAQVDCLYAAGEAMAHLWGAVPDGMKAEHSRDADALAQALIGDLRDGDIVMVKGSNASGLGAVVAQLRAAGLDVKQQTG